MNHEAWDLEPSKCWTRLYPWKYYISLIAWFPVHSESVVVIVYAKMTVEHAL